MGIAPGDKAVRHPTPWTPAAGISSTPHSPRCFWSPRSSLFALVGSPAIRYSSLGRSEAPLKALDPSSSSPSGRGTLRLPAGWLALAQQHQQSKFLLQDGLRDLETGGRPARLAVLVHTAAVAPAAAETFCAGLGEDRLGELPWLLVRGVVLNRKQQLHAAAQLLSRVTTEARLEGDVDLLLWALLELGRARGMSGQMSRANTSLREVLSILDERTASPQRYIALLGIGMLHTQERAFETSLDFNIEALAASREAEDPQGVAHCLSNLGETYLRLRRLSEAEKCYRDAKALTDGTAWTRTQSMVLSGLGALAFSRGESGPGTALIAESNTQLVAAGDDYQVARQELWLVEHLEASGDTESALGYCHEAIARCQRRDLGHIEAQAWNRLADLFTRLGRHEDASAALRACLRCIRATVETQVSAAQQAAEHSHRALLAFQEAAWERGKRAELELQNKALAAALQERERLQAELERASLVDPLTGTGNRRSFNKQLEAYLALSARERRPLSLLILDIDHFKSINDQHGHTVGDEVLQHLCRRVRDRLRVVDFFARWGGEEFVVLLYGTDEEGALRCADDIRRSIADQPMQTSTGPLPTTVSIGVATLEGGHDAGDELIRKADEALFEAKRAGRNRVVRAQGPVRDNSRPST